MMKNPYWFKLRSYFRGFASAISVFVVSTSLHAADMNVLIIGSTADGGDRFGGKSDAFVPTRIATELSSILAGAGVGTVNVVVEDRYKTGSDAFGSSYSYNLASWYHWPYPAEVETTTRWPNLRGELGTVWDYVVLIGDPYTMENMPGHYAHGVEMIAQEVAKGSAEVILLMPWPAAANDQSSVAHYKEVVYRAGKTGGYKVAPAALAWQADGSQTGGGSHPSPRGAYICAASIYSAIWGQSAAASSYTYNDTLANLVNTTVTNNLNATQYSGNKMNFQNPFLMFGDKRRDVHFSERGTSTEAYYANGAKRAMDRAKVTYDDAYRDTYTSSTPTGAIWTNNPMPIAWNHGRDGGYVVNPAYWQLAFTFNFQLNSKNYADDQANDFELARIYSGEVARANTMKNGNSSERLAAWRLIWGQFHKQYPSVEPVRDTDWHVALPTEDAVGAFMYTLYSGRCPLNPGEETSQDGYARRLGYETAWRLGTCSARAPGFKVMPSTATAKTVTPTTTETMTIQFFMQPRNNVTVTVSSSDTSAAIVGTQTLVFTPSNYNVAQTVVVAGVPGASASAPFTIDFATTSGDPVYDGLSDSWAYTTTRTATPVTRVDRGTTQYNAYKNFSLTTDLNATGASSSNTKFAGPGNGTLSWSGSNVVYTPATDYIGPDGFSYWSLNGSNLTTGYIRINVIHGYPAGSVRAEATDSTATEEGRTTGSFAIIREGSTSSPLSVNFTLTGTATVTTDYSINATSPIVIPAGQASVIVTLTPVDDNEKEYAETASLIITAGSGYMVGTTDINTITIADSDNTPPVVDAGADKIVPLLLSGPWNPANISTYSWHDASDTSTITQSGGAVSQLRDKSGNARHMAQSDSVKQPRTGVRTINGRNVLDFDPAAAQIMQVTTAVSGQPSNTITIAVAAHDVDLVGRNAILNFRDRFGLYVDSIYTGVGKATGVADSSVSFGWKRMGTFMSAGVLNWDASASLPDSYVRGFVNGSQVDTDVAYNVKLSGGNYMIMSGNNTLNTTDGAFAEAIVTNGDNSTETLQKLEGYLAHKWGLATNLPFHHPYRSAAPGEPGVSVPLTDASVIDADLIDEPAASWSVVSKVPSNAADPTFRDDAVVNTTATFTQYGVYTLRLTANDGTDTVFDEVTITISAPPVNYTAWVNAGGFAHVLTDINPTANPDGDLMSNLMEFALGTDPTLQDSKSLAIDGSVNGLPRSVNASGGVFEYYFVRRKDHGTSGSVSYTVQFSDDLSGFASSAVSPSFVANSSANGDYEVVKVPFPSARRFGRLQIEPVP